MDKMGMFWGGLFGGLWGFLYFALEFPLAAKTMKLIDQGFKNASGAPLTALFSGTFVFCLMFGTVGVILGGMVGTGRKSV
jgi:hypothetical protein